MGYLNLNIGVRGRMRELQRRADRINNAQYNLRKSQGDNTPYNWRDVRYSGFHNAAANQVHLAKGRNDDNVIWYSHNGQQFPREQYVDEILGSRHTGWYTDLDGRETARGIVVALPRGRFLAGYEWSDNGERVYFADIYDNADDAARAADSEAEHFAEEARKDDARYQEARRLEDETDNSLSRLRECLALRNRPCFAHLREEARELIASIKTARETLRTEYAAYV